MVRKNKTLRRELISTIKMNLKRYLSLIIIIFLGVAFYVGMGINASVLQKTMRVFYEKYNYSDIKISSVFGLTTDELNELKKRVPEIAEIEGKYYVETVVNLRNKDNKYQEKVIAIHSYNKNARINKSEIVEGHEINDSDEIVVDYTMSELGYKLGDEISFKNDSLEDKTYKIVGFIRNPQYISVNKGASNLLNGRIDYYLYIADENFLEHDYYTNAEIKIKDNYQAFTDEYNDYVKEIKEKITKISDEISVERKNQVIEEKTEQLTAVEEEYKKKKTEVELKLEEENNKLIQAEEEIKKAENNILSDEEIDEITTALKKKLDSEDLELNILRETIETTKKQNPFNINSGNIRTLEGKYNDLLAEHNKTQEQYNQALGLKDQMATARMEIPRKKAELKSAKAEYEKAKKAAYEELDKNYKIIQDNKKALEILKNYSWYVYDRSDSYGYGNFFADTKRIDNLAKIIPLIFFIVASLVTATSVTRMIQEERKKMGILKSLGYNNKQINSKYFKYTFTAAIIGLIPGIAFGMLIFPLMFHKVYSILYFIPKIVYEIPYKEALITSLLAFSSSTLMAYVIVSKATTEMPASLMHKKVSQNYKIAAKTKEIKKIKDLPSEKRNAYRNIIFSPGRSFMTMIGIAGCTALIITSLGFRSSIRKVIDVQFENIVDISTQFFYKPTITQYDIDEDYNKIVKMSEVESASLNRVELSSVHVNNKTCDVRTIIPKNIDEFNQNIHLKSVVTDDLIDLSSLDGVVITETLANILKVKKDDTITFIDSSNVSHTAKVSDIAENYVYFYIYMNQEVYKEIYDYDSLNNAIFIKYKDDENNKTLNSKINSSNIYAYFSSISDTKKDTKLVLDRFDAILYVMLIAAGLLAFIVLYNFAKINIGERLTEVATLKVLGYDSDEINLYINYEIKVLTVIGIIVGMFFGYFLTKVVIDTCETDSALLYYKEIPIFSYVLGIALTILFSKIINIFVKNDIKKISMTESLKEAD